MLAVLLAVQINLSGGEGIIYLAGKKGGTKCVLDKYIVRSLVLLYRYGRIGSQMEPNEHNY